MKTCPSCSETYSERIDFCFVDGDVLVLSPSAMDAPMPRLAAQVQAAPPSRPTAQAAQRVESPIRPPSAVDALEPPQPETRPTPAAAAPPPVDSPPAPTIIPSGDEAPSFEQAPEVAPHDATPEPPAPSPTPAYAPPRVPPVVVPPPVVRPPTTPPPVTKTARPRPEPRSAPASNTSTWVFGALAIGLALVVLLWATLRSPSDPAPTRPPPVRAPVVTAPTPVPVVPAAVEPAAPVAAPPAETLAPAPVTPAPVAAPPTTPAPVPVVKPDRAPPTAPVAAPAPTAPAGLWDAAPPPAQAKAFFSSDPSGATVRVDGKVRGTTPVEVELPYGVHIVDLELKGYLKASDRIDVQTAAPKFPFPLQREQRRGNVLIVFEGWDGANLEIDGEARGQLPAQVALTEGAHVFFVSGPRGELKLRREVKLAESGLTRLVLNQ